MKQADKKWKKPGSVWGLSLVCCLLVTFFAGQHQWFLWLDSQFFKVASNLVATPEKKDDVVVIHLPESETPQIKSSLQRQQHLARFITKVAKVKPAAMVLVLDQLPPQHPALDEFDTLNSQLKLVTKSLKGKRNRKTRKELQGINKQLGSLIHKDQGLVDVILKNDVLVAIPVHASDKHYIDPQQKLFVEWPGEKKPPALYLAMLPGLTFPAVKEIHKNNDLNKPQFSVQPVYSRLSQSASSWPLIWRDGDNFYPDLVATLFGRLEGSTSLGWIEGQGMQYSSQMVKTDMAGQVVPLFSLASDKQHDLPTYNFSNIPAGELSGFRKKVVLIGYESDVELMNIAFAVNSLREHVAYHTPLWGMIAEKVMLVLIFFYFLFVISRLRKSAEIILGTFLLFVLVTLQVGMLIIKGYWVPLGPCVSLLFFGHLITFFQKQLNQKFSSLHQQVHEARWLLGKDQYEQDNFTQAFESLKRCYPTTEVIDKIYKTGLEFERQRQYDKALETFNYINRISKGYKDIERRIQSLMNVSGEKPTIISPFNGEKTLVMSDHDLEKPVIGRYELIRELGRGEMGIVYLGKDPKIMREVAIKTLNFVQFEKRELKVIKERFCKEAETAGRLNHPNIVTIYDVGDERDLAFIAMDYIPGRDMSSFVKKGELLPVDVVLKCIIQVADALDYAHKQGVVHRDIKPGNIIYNKKTRLVKVTDFGIARIMDTANTRTGTILGSPAYMSPEQLAGSKVGGTADLFSLGVTLFQLLSGEFPFKGETIASLAYKIANEKHRPIRDVRPELPKGFSRLINKVLQKDPKKRFLTGNEMKVALKKILQEL